MVRPSIRLVLIVCLLSPAVPASGAPQNVAPNVMVLHLANADAFTTVGPIQYMFNPTELPVTQSVPWKKYRSAELEYTGGDPKKMTLELQFDSFEQDPGGYTPVTFAATLQRLAAENTGLPATFGGRLWMLTPGSAVPIFSRVDPQGNALRVVVATTWTAFEDVAFPDRFPFTIDIPGCPELRTAVREIQLNPLVIDPSGAPSRRARVTMAVPNGINPELIQWQAQAAAGQAPPRRIVITMFLPDGTPLRTATVDATGPIALTTPHPADPVPHAILEFSYRLVSLESINPGPPSATPNSAAVSVAVPGEPPSPLLGFQVTIDTGVEQGTAFFKSVSGLKTDTEVTDYEEGGIHGTSHREHGVARWPNLTLVGLPKCPVPLLFRWVSDAAIGRPWRATVTMTPLYLFHGQPRPTRSLVLQGVSPDRYEFPDLSAIRSDGQVGESISFVPAFGVLQALPAVQLPQGK